MTSIKITSKRIALVLSGIVFLLLTTNLIVIYLHYIRGYQYLKGFIRGFYFDNEANIPSLYSSVAILCSAALLWSIGNLAAEKQAKLSHYWKFLSLVFTFLAVDEFCSLHEYLIRPVKTFIEGSFIDSDYLYFAWFIPYTLLLLVIGVIFLRFLFKLPRRTGFLFLSSAAIFLSGAVMMEMIGGNYWAQQGWSLEGDFNVDLRYSLIITVEELLEMLGIILFIYALTSYYLSDQKERAFLIRFKDTQPPG